MSSPSPSPSDLQSTYTIDTLVDCNIVDGGRESQEICGLLNPRGILLLEREGSGAEETKLRIELKEGRKKEREENAKWSTVFIFEKVEFCRKRGRLSPPFPFLDIARDSQVHRSTWIKKAWVHLTCKDVADTVLE